MTQVLGDVRPSVLVRPAPVGPVAGLLLHFQKVVHVVSEERVGGLREVVHLVDPEDAVPLVDGFADLRRAPGPHQGPVFVVAGAKSDVLGLGAGGAQRKEEQAVHLVGQDGEVQAAGRQDLDLGQAEVTVQRQENPRDDLGMSQGKGLGLEHVRVEGGDVVIPYLQGIVHLPVKSQGVGPYP